MGAIAYTQENFRVRDDSAALNTDSGWLANENTDPAARETGTANRFRIRFTIDETGNATDTQTMRLTVSKNAGAYNNVTASSSDVQVTGGVPTDGAACSTQLLGSPGTGSFEADGSYDEGDGVTPSWSNDKQNFAEFEWCVYIVDADVADADTLDFRVQSSGGNVDTWTNQPQITVSKPFEAITKSVGTTGRDYSTFSLFNAALPSSLVTANEQWTAEVYADGDINDFFDLSGITTDATRFIKYTVPEAERHSGTRNTGARLRCTSNLSDGEDIFYVQNVAYTVVEWLEITYGGSSTDSGGSSAAIKSNANNCVFRNMLVYDVRISSRNRGLSMRAVDEGIIENSIAINIDTLSTQTNGASGIVVEPNTGSWCIVRNNTTYDCTSGNSDGTGIEFSALTGPPVGTVYGRNNIAMGNDVDFTFAGSGTFDLAYHYSEDATADDQGGDGHLISQTASTTFESVTGGSEDLHLKSGSGAIGVGRNLGTGDHATDIDGTDRAATKQLAWDIGAHQFTTSTASEDFLLANGEGIIANGDTSVTLRAGVHYPMPADATRAFFRHSNALNGAREDDASAQDNETSDFSAWPDQSSIASTVTLNRYVGGRQVSVEWQYWEYIGPSGGANEFIVRLRAILTLGTTDTTADSSTYTATDNNDVVAFIAGQGLNHVENNNGNQLRHTTSKETGPLIRVTRGTSGNAASVSVVAVEFTGSNWTIQRITHTYSAAGSTETESMTTVGSLAKTFIENQLRTTQVGLDESGHECWASATNQLSFQLQSGAGVGHDAVVYVIENTQSGGTRDMNVQRSGALTRGTGGSTPDVWTSTVTAVSSVSRSAVMGLSCRSTGTGGVIQWTSLNARLISTTSVELSLQAAGQTQTYRYEVVEMPTIGRSLPYAPEPLKALIMR